MTTLFRFGILLLLSGSLPGGMVSDFEYGRAGGERLLLDVSGPDGPGPFPVALLIHGGGWTGGDKTGDIAPLLRPLTAAGFTCFIINYRLAPQHRWPACRNDVLAAIRWVKAHATDYRGDPARVPALRLPVASP